MPIKKTLSLQRGDVLHHRRLAGEPKMTLDLARARRDAFLALLALDEIENVSLPIGQHVCIIVRTFAKTSSNEQIPLAIKSGISPLVRSGYRENYSRTRSSRNWHQR